MAWTLSLQASAPSSSALIFCQSGVTLFLAKQLFRSSRRNIDEWRLVKQFRLHHEAAESSANLARAFDVADFSDAVIEQHLLQLIPAASATRLGAACGGQCDPHASSGNVAPEVATANVWLMTKPGGHSGASTFVAECPAWPPDSPLLSIFL